jgi:hypothetical protein
MNGDENSSAIVRPDRIEHKTAGEPAIVPLSIKSKDGSSRLVPTNVEENSSAIVRRDCIEYKTAGEPVIALLAVKVNDGLI